MTGPEHYRDAEQLLSDASFTDSYGNPVRRDGTLMNPREHDSLTSKAQVHATLALAAATALNDYPNGAQTDDVDAWHAVASVTAKARPRPSVRGGDPIGHEAELGYRNEQDDRD